jgi:hypothetical protein
MNSTSGTIRTSRIIMDQIRTDLWVRDRGSATFGYGHNAAKNGCVLISGVDAISFVLFALT